MVKRGNKARESRSVMVGVVDVNAKDEERGIDTAPLQG